MINNMSCKCSAFALYRESVQLMLLIRKWCWKETAEALQLYQHVKRNIREHQENSTSSGVLPFLPPPLSISSSVRLSYILAVLISDMGTGLALVNFCKWLVWPEMLSNTEALLYRVCWLLWCRSAPNMECGGICHTMLLYISPHRYSRCG